MGGKSSTTQSSQTNQALQPFLGAYESLLSQAEGTAGQPLQQYGGQMIEGFTPQQLQAFGLVGNTTGATGDATASPYLQAAQQDFSNATQPLWSGVQQFSPSAINQYESPYTSDVVNATQNQFNLQNQQQQNQLSGNVASAGAFGGDRSAILASSLAGQQQTAQAPTIANLENTGYQTALGEFNQQQQAQLGANEANSWLNSQAAFGEGNLGQEAQNLQLTGANALQGAGAEQQALGQEQLNVPYEQFEQQQAYPFQTEQWLAGMETGLGGSAGSTSQGQSSTETPFNPLSALMGLTGIGGATGAFGSNGYLSNMFGSGGMDSEMQDMALAEMPFSKGGGIVLPFPHHRVRRHGGGIAGYADGSDIDPDDVPIPQPNPMRGAAATGTDGGWQAPYKIDLNETPVPTSVNPGWGADNPLWTSLIAGAGAGLAHNNFGDALQTAATDYSKGKQSMLESSQKAAEAQNEADYRKTSVEEEANGLSQRAYDAAQTLKQQGQHQTAEEQNWAAQRSLEEKRINQEAANEAAGRRIQEEQLQQGRYSLMPGMGTDAKGQQVPGAYRLNGKTGEQEFLPGVVLSPKSGQPQIDPGNEKILAHAIATYQQAPLSSFAMAKPEGQQLMAQVMAENPNYDAKRYNEANKAQTAFGTGSQGNSVRFMNNAVGHLNLLDQYASAMNNGDVKAANAVQNAIRTQFGADPVTNFNALKGIVGQEVVKAIVANGGSAGERDEAANAISSSGSIDQLLGATRAYRSAMKTQLLDLKQQYQDSTGLRDFDNKLLPETKRELYGGSHGAIPSMPTGLPQGSMYSPSRQQWKDPTGRIYNANGQPVQ